MLGMDVSKHIGSIIARVTLCDTHLQYVHQIAHKFVFGGKVHYLG